MGGEEAYGEAFGRRFGIENAPVFINRTLVKSVVAVTYLRQDQPTGEVSEKQPVEDSYLASFVMRDNPKYTLWENGRALPTRYCLSGQTAFYDYKEMPVIDLNHSLNALHFYIPRAAFDAVADNAEVPRIGGLKLVHGAGVDDTVMAGLGTALLPAFQNPESASRLFVDHVTLAAAAHVAHTYGGMRLARLKRGGLAPWQERRALELLDAQLDGDVSQADLAQACGLSVTHFARAFRISTGMAPHQWLLKHRVEKAKAALRDTHASLSEIAFICGFADQSHFTRVFTRLAGTSPGAWRRSIRS